jgi:threonine aldolase
LAGPSHLLDGLYHQRRMFGGGLRQAWPYAAVSLHYLEGFPARFAEAAAMAGELLSALADHSCVEIVRSPASTNVSLLRIYGGKAALLPERLAARGITIRPPLSACGGCAEFELVVNETIRHRPIAQTIADFSVAIRSG